MNVRLVIVRALTAMSLGLLPAPSISWADEKTADTLPARKIILFTSGVGYFEHAGRVNGNSTVDMKFNVNNINDLLKSLVLQDMGGGQVSTVTYESRDPVTRTLKTFMIDLTDNPALGNLLHQARGQEVELEAPNKLRGTIVGVEVREKRVKEGQTISETFVNLLTDDGLRSISLNQTARIKFLNEKLDSEFRQALKLLASANDTDKKTVSLSFLGNGERPVRVGYIREMPLWKTSYRLVLDDNAKPFLQGWAIVENTTETDWSNVELSLVSGRPISFRMDLYQPLYVPRPTVVPELYASLMPQKYNQDLLKDGLGKSILDVDEGRIRNAKEVARDNSYSLGAKAAPASRADSSLFRIQAGAGAAAPEETRAFEQLGRSVNSSAQGGDVGELFQYRIETPVTLARQKSAMLPIVNSPVEGNKVSIYNASVHAQHPLNGFELTNSTDLHLMQGPITVFDGSAYAGDARIEDLAPKAKRLISYAMDLDSEVASEAKSAPEELVSVKLYKGTLATSRKFRRSTIYTVKNSGKEAKNVLVEYPFDANWKLVTPEKPTEKTRDLYRFAVTVKPGASEKLTVTEEMTRSESIGLANVDDSSIQVYLRANAVAPSVKAALAEVMKRRHALSELAAQRERLQGKISNITQEQERIRQNMSQLDRNSDLYNRYVNKFSDQETQVEKLRAEIDRVTTALTDRQKELDEYLLGLNVG